MVGLLENNMTTDHSPGDPWAPQNLRIASPCEIPWDSMTGDDRSRFCGKCRLNVFNLSWMSRDEAERLLREREGRICVRYFQRLDGTVLTRDCIEGLWAARTKSLRTVAGGITMSSAVLAGMISLEGCTVLMGAPCNPSINVRNREIPCSECTILRPGLADCPVCHGTGRERVELPGERVELGAPRRASVDSAITLAKNGDPTAQGALIEQLRRALRECIAIGPSYAAAYDGVPLPEDPVEAKQIFDRVKNALRSAILDAENTKSSPK